MIEFVFDPIVAKWVCEGVEGLEPADLGPHIALGAVEDGVPLMGCVYHMWRPASRDLGVTLRANTDELMKRRVSKERLFPVFFDYAYNQAKAERLTAYIREGNKGSMRLAKRLGFKREGTLRRAYDGRANCIVFGQLKKECKFLQEPAPADDAREVA